MIGSIFKAFGFFFVCFLILSIPVSGKPLFDHLFKISKPVGKVIAEKAEDGLDQSRDLGERLFKNSLPRNASDEIKVRNSSVKKQANLFQTPKREKFDEHSKEDQEELERTIQNEF
jgi:hypothetical protein